MRKQLTIVTKAHHNFGSSSDYTVVTNYHYQYFLAGTTDNIYHTHSNTQTHTHIYKADVPIAWIDYYKNTIPWMRQDL